LLDVTDLDGVLSVAHCDGLAQHSRPEMLRRADSQCFLSILTPIIRENGHSVNCMARG
jgi:hypothetical protein